MTLSIVIIRHDEREEKGLCVTRQTLKAAELCDFGKAEGGSPRVMKSEEELGRKLANKE